MDTGKSEVHAVHLALYGLKDAQRVQLLRFPNQYYAFLAHFGLPDSPGNEKRIAAYLDNLADLRSTTCDWALSSPELARHARIAATSQPLPVAAEAGIIRPDALPGWIQEMRSGIMAKATTESPMLTAAAIPD